MADLRTTVTELVTGLGTLGFDSVDHAISTRPPEMVSVSPETWDLLRRAYDGGGFVESFDQAWSNGVAFLHAGAGLRGRRPVAVEWKGSHRAPGDEVAPIDLRIDHVYLISCKYMSRIMINASPAHLFERLLIGAHGVRGEDWYEKVAPDEYRQLYEAVISDLGLSGMARTPGELNRDERRRIVEVLRPGWPAPCRALYEELSRVVADRTAQRWQAAMSRPGQSEGMLWRILRMGSAPYFVLGTSTPGPLRVRVATPWDWRLHFRLKSFMCAAEPGGQPRVGWLATVADRHSSAECEVRGHVEIRWSHGRFGGMPEAKVYLDTPHSDVPGYFTLS